MALFIMVISSRSRILFKSGISPLQRQHKAYFTKWLIISCIKKMKKRRTRCDLKSADVNMNLYFLFMALLYSQHFILLYLLTFQLVSNKAKEFFFCFSDTPCFCWSSSHLICSLGHSLPTVFWKDMTKPLIHTTLSLVLF